MSVPAILSEEAHGIRDLRELVARVEQRGDEVISIVPEVNTATTEPSLTGFYFVFFRQHIGGSINEGE